MKIGDKVLLKNRFDIGSFKKHGIIIGIHSSWAQTLEIRFADGVVENYNRRDVTVISGKEYFKLQLS